ncbi:MAG: ABC transporter permease subunit [Candidatus Komeilibacteria bacterium]
MSWSRIKAIAGKEFVSYFNSPIAYIFIGVFLIVSMWLFFQDFFVAGQATMRSYLSLLPWIFLFLTPAITMRLWSEEKKTGTVELLLTMPVRDEEVVLGKFFSSLGFLLVNLLLSLTLPITIALLGPLDWGPVIGGYIGALLLGAAYLALGLYVSALTKNQIVAFLLAVVACFIFFIIGTNMVLDSVGTWLAGILSWLGLSAHFANVAKGVLDSRDIIYYLSFVLFFLWLNVRALQARHWN